MRVSLTGHRGGCLRSMYDTCMMQFIMSRPGSVASGMAMGWDTAGALAAVNLGIPLECYLPFESQSWKWPREDFDRHAALLKRARSVEVCSPGGFTMDAYHLRNMRLVDSCDYMLAWWDGRDSGGTAHAIRYANERAVDVKNMFDNTKKLRNIDHVKTNHWS